MCQFCENRGTSIIEERNTLVSYLVVIILIMCLGWYGLLLAPFCFGVLRQHIHRCPKCLNAIKEKSIFSSLEDNVRVITIELTTLYIDIISLNWQVWHPHQETYPRIRIVGHCACYYCVLYHDILWLWWRTL